MKRLAKALLAFALLSSVGMTAAALCRETSGLPDAGIVASMRRAGPWAHAALALGAACLVVTAAGARARWPRGPAIVRGLGHAAFVLALIGAARGFAAVFPVAQRLGPAMTPADIADVLDAAIASAIAGAVAETIALGGAGLLRLRPSPAAPSLPVPRI
jgi:hypothetical protein